MNFKKVNSYKNFNAIPPQTPEKITPDILSPVVDQKLDYGTKGIRPILGSIMNLNSYFKMYFLFY
ncbi:MAG: hypothetical protein C0407_14165 [Desulfobacca sp.]|nr:hypothetical protein [Desulfobacca sp.]